MSATDAPTAGAPSGIARRESTAADRPGGCAALAWALGLSPRSASRLLAAFGVSVSRMRARRDVQEAGQNPRRKQAEGADETVVRVKGETTVVGVVADAATGEVLGLEVLVKRDSDRFMEWLGDFARDYGVGATVTDALIAYKPTKVQDD